LTEGYLEVGSELFPGGEFRDFAYGNFKMKRAERYFASFSELAKCFRQHIVAGGKVVNFPPGSAIYYKNVKLTLRKKNDCFVYAGKE